MSPRIRRGPARLVHSGLVRAGSAFETFRARNEPVPDSPMITELRESPGFQDGVRRLADQLGRPFGEVLEEASDDLRGMSATHDQTVTHYWDRLGRWMLRGFDLIVDEDSLHALRKLDRDHSLVFLISHKSYLDEWIVPPTVMRFGLNPPFGLAGANLDFFPLGTIARRTGIVHIRRATSELPVYKFALRSFMGQLVRHHANLIWSIEGGRSRTGKLRPPRFGLLRYVVDAVDQRDLDEVYLVPVSIVYDQLPAREVQLMTAEARGQGKTPENISWFVGYLRGLARRLGRVYLDFGEPLPLRTRLDELRVEGGAERTAVERIAVEMCHRINMATPVTPTAIVCIALLGADRALTVEEILQTVHPMADYLRRRNWKTAGGANLMDRATLRHALRDLVDTGVVESFTGTTTVWGIAPGEELTAAIYRNTAVHVLVNRAITEIVLSRFAEGEEIGARPGWRYALRLRELLKFDFFFSARRDFAIELQHELSLMDPSGVPVDQMTPEEASRFLDHGRPLVAHLVLRAFIENYWILATQLADEGDRQVDGDQGFIDDCLKLGEQWVRQRRVASAESISGEIFAAGIKLATHRGLMGRDAAPEGLAQRRRDFLTEIEGVQQRIAEIARRADREPEVPAAAGLG